jgi:ribulose-phosphate 3-epimerase
MATLTCHEVDEKYVVTDNNLRRFGMDRFGTLGASVSCFDLFNLERQFEAVHAAPIDYLHYDIVDGSFNQCIILGLPLFEAIRPHTMLPIDVHLAVYDPSRFIDQFAEAGADIISIHPEGSKDLQKDFDHIRRVGCLPALALRSETTVGEDLLPILEQAAFVTKLTVNPGFSGQKIQSTAFEKMKMLRELMEAHDIDTPIVADGNVNAATIPQLVASGATMFVGGTSGLFLKDQSVKESAESLLAVITSITKK